MGTSRRAEPPVKIIQAGAEASRDGGRGTPQRPAHEHTPLSRSSFPAAVPVVVHARRRGCRTHAPSPFTGATHNIHRASSFHLPQLQLPGSRRRNTHTARRAAAPAAKRGDSAGCLRATGPVRVDRRGRPRARRRQTRRAPRRAQTASPHLRRVRETLLPLYRRAAAEPAVPGRRGLLPERAAGRALPN